jgi:hypothetical protein
MRIPGFSKRHRPESALGNISSHDGLSITRRGFIAGAASTAAVVSSGYAEANPVQFSIEEDGSEIAIEFRNERCLTAVSFKIAKDYWSMCAPGSDVAVAAPGKCKPPRFAVTQVAAKTTPDGSIRRMATIDIRNAGFAGQKNTFSAKFVFQLVDQDCQLALTTVGWPRPGKTRFAPVDFIEFMSEGQLCVELADNQAQNLVQALFGKSVTSAPKAKLAVGKDLSWTLSGLFSMPAGLDPSSAGLLTFGRLRFAPTSHGTSPFAKEVLGAAFPKLFAKSDAAFSPPPGMAGYSEGVLVGTAAVGLGKCGKIPITAKGNSPATAAFLQFGNPAETVSGVTGDFEVWVKQEKLEGPFLTEGATIVRYGAGGTSGFARMPIASKSFEVATAHGRFCIEAADPVIPQPGADQVKPGIVLSTDNGQLKSFEVDALIRQAFIPFPADAAGSKRAFFSRLDFSGADCKFVLDPLAELTPLYSAGSFIRLCVPSNAPAGRDPVRLGLDQAVLRAVRPDDLLSLKFRFSGLALTSGGNPLNKASEELVTRIVPLRAGACGTHLAEKVNEARRNGASLSARFLPGTAVDDRPIMVVEFPPQHVAERAYFRQIDDGADPPDVALSDDAAEALGHWLDVLDRYRKGGDVDIDKRIAARREVQLAKCLAEKATARAQASTVTFHQFCGSFDREVELQPLSRCWPEDQKIYIGSEWLDPDVRRFARQLAAKMARKEAQRSSDEFRTTVTKASKVSAIPPPVIDEAVREKLPAVDLSDPDFQNWAAAYDRWGERLFGGLPRYCGPDSVQALVDTGQINSATLAMLVAKIEADVGGPEDFSTTEPTEARLSGPTRLAFRINCNDFEPGGGSFPFTLADLTNWSRFDLSVVRRAEKLLDFDSSGRLPPHWARKEILDPASLLLHQGIHPARNWLPGANSQRVTVAQRMAEVYASSNTPPQPLETAIELPFRLTLSPAQDARWRTPALPPRSGSPIPLWQASLDENVSRSSLRAIWSEDFQPDVLRDGTAPTPHGVWAPWDPPVPQDDGGPPHAKKRFRAVMDAGDRHELVTLSSVYGMPVIGRRDPSMHLLSDGDQIEPPSGYRLLGLPDDSDAIYSPRALNVSELALSALGGSVSLDTHFQPPAGVTPIGQNQPLFVLDVERWRHTAVLGRDISVEVVYKGFLFPLGNRVSFVKLTERRFMRHPAGGPTAYLIQRMFLRVGNPRKAFPALGQANLGRCFPPQTINILTRRTPDIVDPTDRPSIGWNAAPPYVQEYANGAVSFSSDGKTPLDGLVFWPRVSSSESGNVRFEVQIDDTGGSVSMPMLFVDNVAAHTPETVAALTRYYNRKHMESKRTVLHGGTPRRYAIETKQGDSTFETLNWILMAEGGGGETGDIGPSKNSNFVLSSPMEGADQPPFYPYLDTCVIRLNQVGKFTGGQAPMTAARYYSPYLATGFQDPANSSETFFQTVPTAALGLPPMAFGSSGDRAAGVGRPENQIVALSRKNGPIGGSKPLAPPPSVLAQQTSTPRSAQSKAAQTSSTTTAPDPVDYAMPAEFDPSKFNPTSFFGSFGKLLGIIDLGEVIQAAADLTGMPQLSETIDYASTQGWDIVRQSVLQPILDILDTLDKTWASMNVGITGSAADQIKKVFPDVASAEDALRTAVKKALAAAAPPLDQQAQLIGVVYENARALINALQRMAADPLGPISIALQKQVDFLTNAINKDIQDATDGIPALIDNLSKPILAKIGSVLSDHREVFDALFRFDDLVDRSDYSPRVIEVVREKIDAIRKDASNIIQNVVADDQLFEAFRKRLVQELETDRKLPANTNIADDLLKIEGSLNQDPPSWRGPLYDTLAPLLGRVVVAGNNIQSIGKKIVDAALSDAISVLFNVLSSGVGAVADLLILPVVVTCDTAATILCDLLAAIGRGETSAKTWLQWLFPGLVPFKTVAEQLQETLKTFPGGVTWADQLRTVIEGPIGDIVDQLTDVAKLPKEHTESEISEIVSLCRAGDLHKLSDLANELVDQIAIRKKLLDSVKSVAQSVASTLSSFPLGIDQDAGKRAVVAALSIQSVVTGLPLDPRSVELRRAIATLKRDSNPPATDYPPNTRPSDFAEELKKEIDQVNAAASPTELTAAVVHAAGIANGQLVRLQVFFDAENALFTVGVNLQSASLSLSSDLLQAARSLLDPAVKTIGDLCNKLGGYVDVIRGKLKSLEDVGPTARAIIAPLTDKINRSLDELSQSFTNETSALNIVSDATKKLDTSNPNLQQINGVRDALSTAINKLNGIISAAKDAGNAISDITQAVLKGQIAQLIDVNAPRREIESLIRDLVPHKATMAYNLDTQLSPFADVFIPDLDRGDGRLTIDTTAVVDLLSPDQTPKTTVKGVLDPFNIHLFGDSFDVVTLKFQRATFGSSPGSSFNFSIDLEDVVLGEMVAFLQELQSYLTPSDGNGFYLRPASGSPGIEVGYGLNLGTISLGPVSFINVSLNAGCRLPFDKSNALFTISLSRPDSPFLISVGIYGGGGYLALIADGKSIVGFEASFEFGGVAAFSFGPLTGIGMLTTGIFLRKLYDKTTIEGFFFCGGSAHIACFGISASLMVSISMEPGGAMVGQAVFTFSFSIGFAHIDFHITVFKTQAKLGGSASAEPPRTRFAELASDLPPARLASPASYAAFDAAESPRIFATTMSPNRDWRQYRRYFATDIKPRWTFDE